MFARLFLVLPCNLWDWQSAFSWLRGVDRSIIRVGQTRGAADNANARMEGAIGTEHVSRSSRPPAQREPEGLTPSGSLVRDSFGDDDRHRETWRVQGSSGFPRTIKWSCWQTGN
ncbi:hypothetical protein B0T19DRAFT_138363 [Cercophora scortea]|uniref:Secreted protein n=1 Tax=Cercophora scortea TaxID=314031 RepID=A0AAE0IYX1_9PEZI|nr:hypothetical protein B0T19DRAFT_138363 [Cercophora scortea]